MIYSEVYQCFEFKSRRGKNTNVTAQKSNSNTVWFKMQTSVIFSSNLVSQVTLRSSGTVIMYGCHLLRCLYNLLYFLWLYNDFLIILYNILKITEYRLRSNYNIKYICTNYTRLDACLISTSRRSLRDKATLRLLKLHFLWSGCGRMV